jgi:hypothetical protein
MVLCDPILSLIAFVSKDKGIQCFISSIVCSQLAEIESSNMWNYIKANRHDVNLICYVGDWKFQLVCLNSGKLRKLFKCMICAWKARLACAKKDRIIRKATEQFNGIQKLLFIFVGLKMKNELVKLVCWNTYTPFV